MNCLNTNKKLSVVLSLTLSALVFAGCSKKPAEFTTNKAYTSQKAYENGDIVQINGNIYNGEKMKRFYKNFEKEEGDSVRLTKYDKKGNPTIIDLKIDTEITPHEIIYEIDHSLASKTGISGEEKEEYQCEAIKMIKDSPETYGLEGCGYVEGEDDIIKLLELKNTK